MIYKQSWSQCHAVCTGNGQAALPHPSGWKTRSVDAGNFASLFAGRMGRVTRLPPQLGQRPPSLLSAQSRQKVHSNVQMSASVAAGGRSLSQHSQDGRSASIGDLRTCIGEGSSAIRIGRCLQFPPSWDLEVSSLPSGHFKSNQGSYISNQCWDLQALGFGGSAAKLCATPLFRLS
jgi:hypothetical protein